MTSSKLLALVLPIDALADYQGRDEYIVPKYDNEKSYEENVKDYKLYYMVFDEMEFEYLMDTAAPDERMSAHILKLLYYTGFPDVFFNYIANGIDGMPLLQPEGVEAFLEGNYGPYLRQPDYDYLESILRLWSGSYTVLRYSTFNKALEWLQKKSLSLPTWSSEPAAPPVEKISESIVSKWPAKRLGEMGLMPKEAEILAKALEGVGLLDAGKLIPRVRPGAVAGVLRFLVNNNYITSGVNSSFRTLCESFDFTGCLRTVHGKERDLSVAKSIAKSYYDKTLRYFEDMKFSR